MKGTGFSPYVEGPVRFGALALGLRNAGWFATVVLATLLAAACSAQTPSAPAAPETLPQTPQGTVLFERHTEEEVAVPPAQAAGDEAVPAVTDAERAAVHISAYDLDARLIPATGRLAMRARLTLRNDGAVALSHVVLQISSSLTWETATADGRRLPLAQHLLETDADHTGAAREVVLTLAAPLAPGAVMQLDTFYSGTIGADATRLIRIGATPAQAAATDWDAVGPSAASPGLDAAVRGFGNVLWYPVAAPALFLGDGAKLFRAIAEARFRNQDASVHLHLAVEYVGDPPVAAYFCGRRQALAAVADDADAPTTSGAGIASADFAAEPLGFRLPSLFVVEHAESLIAPLPLKVASASSSFSSSATTPSEPAVLSASPEAQIGSPSASPLLAVETADDGALPRLADAAQGLTPLLQQWFGPQPLSALTLLDHSGEPFEDGPLVVAPLSALAASTAGGALAHSLTHAWVQTGQPWMDEGLAQFIALLWTEQQQGRTAMVDQLTELLRPLALVEPAISRTASGEAGEPIIATPDEVYYRRKAAAVWLMLRGIAGDAALASALTSWRGQAVSHESAEAQAVAFERLLEKASGKDLGWFFRDWVLHDRGLPELSIVDIAPRTLPAGKGHDSGWLVAVTLHNDGAAECEVPVIVRSGTYSTTRRMRVPAFGNVTDRVLVEAAPTEVVVNDGTTPETTVSIHRRAVVLNTDPNP